MNRAVEMLAEKRANPGPRRRRAAAKPLKELGEHPDGGAVNVMDGRYGPYVKWEKVNATLPKDIEPANVTLEQALALIAEKSGQEGHQEKGPGQENRRQEDHEEDRRQELTRALSSRPKTPGSARGWPLVSKPTRAARGWPLAPPPAGVSVETLFAPSGPACHLLAGIGLRPLPPHPLSALTTGGQELRCIGRVS